MNQYVIQISRRIRTESTSWHKDGSSVLTWQMGAPYYLGGRVDRVIVNDGPFQPEVLETYAQEKSEPVKVDRAQLARLVPYVVIEHLNLENDKLARHDPERLVQAIFPDDK